MNVEVQVGGTAHGLDDERPERQVGDKVGVHHVHVQDAGAGRLAGGDHFLEAGMGLGLSISRGLIEAMGPKPLCGGCGAKLGAAGLSTASMGAAMSPWRLAAVHYTSPATRTRRPSPSNAGFQRSPSSPRARGRAGARPTALGDTYAAMGDEATIVAEEMEAFAAAIRDHTAPTKPQEPFSAGGGG